MRLRLHAAFAPLVAVLACAEPTPRPELTASLERAAAADLGSTVRLADVAPFAWDTAWIFGPYSVSPTVMPDHPAIRAAKHTSVMGQENAHALVLMTGRRVVGYAEVPRHLADFDLAGAGRQQLDRAGATFTICRDTLADRRVLAISATKTRTWISCAPAAAPEPAGRD